MTFNPGDSSFRLRTSIVNAGNTAVGGGFQLYLKKNSGSYAAVTTSSTGGVKAYDASSDADDMAIRIPRLYPFSPDWQLSGAAVDLDFAGNRVYPDGSAFTDHLSCSRASDGYAETSSGGLTVFSSNILRITDSGLLREPARTNVVLWNRDLTNAAWVPTDITAAKDQTGPDGVSNSASSIVATAGNGTILQSITLASAARFQSAYVKRISGSGTIQMTMDNGATWTNITVTSNWTQATIPFQTLANPTVGFRIVTSGDKIAVDFVQNEDQTSSATYFSNASSPIATTTTAATRAADSITGLGTFNSTLVSGAASVLIDVKQNFLISSPTSWEFTFIADGTSNLQFLKTRASGGAGGSNTSVAMRQASIIEVSVNFSPTTFYDGVKVASSYDANGESVTGQGITPATSTTAFNPAPSGTVQLGTGGPDSPTFCYFRRLVAWNSRVSDATLQGFTAS